MNLHEYARELHGKIVRVELSGKHYRGKRRINKQSFSFDAVSYDRGLVLIASYEKLPVSWRKIARLAFVTDLGSKWYFSSYSLKNTPFDPKFKRFYPMGHIITMSHWQDIDRYEDYEFLRIKIT